MKPQLNINDTFAMGRIVCTVTTIDSFGLEAHYGFTWREDVTGDYHAGWMPCLFVDQFTGHHSKGD